MKCREGQEEFETNDKRRKFCNHSCAMKYSWRHHDKNKALKTIKEIHGKHFKGYKNSGSFTSERMEGNQHRKGKKPWNYIDGRSKFMGPGRYGDDWFKIRLLIYKRDNYTCQRCAEKMSRTPFHIHHKIPFLISFDNSLSNLITLCPPCHRKVEAIIMRELKQIKVEV